MSLWLCAAALGCGARTSLDGAGAGAFEGLDDTDAAAVDAADSAPDANDPELLRWCEQVWTAPHTFCGVDACAPSMTMAQAEVIARCLAARCDGSAHVCRQIQLDMGDTRSCTYGVLIDLPSLRCLTDTFGRTRWPCLKAPARVFFRDHC